MVLCAGLGERLRPLTEELPKPLLPVGDRPALAHILREVAAAGYDEACANTHWLSGKFDDFTSICETTLTLIHEPVIRGVAGGIAGARPCLQPPIVVWNGDILLTQPPLARLRDKANAGSGICLGVAASQGRGTVGLDAAGRVVRLRGESYGLEAASGDYVGVVGLAAGALAELPERGCLIRDYCLPRLRRGEAIDTCAVSGPWWDIGSFAGYADANDHWLATHANRAHGSFVDPSARVGSAVELQRSIVGAHAEVTGSGALSGCIVWPGSRVSAPLANCVVTPRRVQPLSVARLPS